MAPLNGPPDQEIELVCPAAGAFRVALEGVEASAEETSNNSAAKVNPNHVWSFIRTSSRKEVETAGESTT